MKIKFFNLGRKIAQKSTYRHKLGCVIVKKNKVVSVGFNKANKTHPKAQNSFNTIHAEFSAIMSVPKGLDLTGAVAYVYREYKDGSLALAKPCMHCEFLLKQSGVKIIYYTDENKFGTISF